MNGWESASFRTFAQALTEHLYLRGRGTLGEPTRPSAPSSPAPPGTILREKSDTASGSQQTFIWTPPKGIQLPDGARAGIDITVLRDVDGRWKVCVGSVLIALNRCNRAKPEDSAANLKRALETSALPYFCEFRARKVIRPERIVSYLNGEIENLDLWEPAPRIP
jgi:hypothetical protein